MGRPQLSAPRTNARRRRAGNALDAAFSQLSAATLEFERAANELDASDHRRDRVRDLGAVCRVVSVEAGALGSSLKGASHD